MDDRLCRDTIGLIVPALDRLKTFTAALLASALIVVLGASVARGSAGDLIVGQDGDRLIGGPGRDKPVQ